MLKQQTGVSEWFEPLLKPWRHYVPVANDLRNLTTAVKWVQANPQRAAAIAANAGELVGCAPPQPPSVRTDGSLRRAAGG